MVGVIIINKKVNFMSKSLLFAIDNKKQEVIISNSEQGTKKINSIERINKQDNDILFNAVSVLTSITKSIHFDIKVFKEMQKICEMIYKNHLNK
jgi:hypothetical protein|tara:strand:- start:96 stop:377 length:282 start_codon:yes stop_codon:yes gene_type:complete